MGKVLKFIYTNLSTTLLFLLFIPSGSYSVELGHRFIHKFNLSDDLSFRTGAYFRAENHNLFSRHYDFGLVYNLPEDIKLRASYRYKYTRDRSSALAWESGQRPHIQLQKDFNVDSSFKLSLRNRHEYRRFKDNDSKHRNRFMVALKYKEGFNGIKPYIRNEMFYDYEESEYNLNRFDIGFTFPKVKEVVKPDIALRYTSTKSKDGSWSSRPSINLKWSF